MKNNFILCFFLLISIIACNTLVQKQNEIPYLFTLTDKKGISNVDKDMSYVRGINVNAHLEILNDSSSLFKLPLPSSKDILIEKTSLSHSDSSSFWIGKVVGDSLSFVYITYSNEMLNGRINTAKNQYRIIYIGNEVYQIAQINPDKMTEDDADGSVPKITDTSNNQKLIGCSDPATEIDIMVIYTAAAEKGTAGALGMKTLIDQSVHLTNLSYQNSSINQHIRLVHTEKVNYVESGNSVIDKAALQNKKDGKLDSVHALRDAYAADIVILIVETDRPGECGQAYILDPVQASFEAFAFGVVRRECAADKLSFAHELGHLMGARHHDDVAKTPFLWCHGHQAGNYRTIMSKQPGTIRTTNFSNPNNRFLSADITGIPGISENYKVLNATAWIVSKFRCKTPN